MCLCLRPHDPAPMAEEPLVPNFRLERRAVVSRAILSRARVIIFYVEQEEEDRRAELGSLLSPDRPPLIPSGLCPHSGASRPHSAVTILILDSAALCLFFRWCCSGRFLASQRISCSLSCTHHELYPEPGTRPLRLPRLLCSSRVAFLSGSCQDVAGT